jgi:hypothetical protein
MIRDEQFKLVVGTGRRARLDGYETGRPLPGPYLRLFDLEAGPGEDHDLAGDPSRRDVVADLRGRLLQRFRDTWPPNAPAPPVRDGSDRELFHYLTPRDAPAPRR